ncbi:hypothetical protein D3C72_96040 [compost metagenome]
MAKIYAEHEHPSEGPREPRKKGMPLWPWLLLLALIALPLLWSQWSKPQAEQTAYFNPTSQATVIHYQGHDWVPVPNAASHQATFPIDQMKVVGHDKGHDLYSNVVQGAEGGGAGPITPGQTPAEAQDRIYLRTGPDTYVPLMWKK